MARVMSPDADVGQSSLETSLLVANRKRAERMVKPAKQPADSIDFSSNDCFGFAREKELASAIMQEMDHQCSARLADGAPMLGSTGCRLLTGNSSYHEEIECMLAAHHKGESAILFNSGFDLNLGFYGSVPQSGDVVIMDELMHASVKEGMKLSRGEGITFKHNDVEDLRRQLAQRHESMDVKSRKPNIIIAVESVYSMDGHFAPLEEICTAAEEVGACVVVDEAHGTGVLGPEGRGLAAQLELEERIFCRVYTFGKALGVQGAVAIGPRVLKDYLMNNAKPIIFSASLSTWSLVSIDCAYKLLKDEWEGRQKHLQVLIRLFHERAANLPPDCVLKSSSPVQGIIVPGNAEVKTFSQSLLGCGLHVLPIYSPVVPQGTERLRIILHFHNTEKHVNTLMDAVEEIMRSDQFGPSDHSVISSNKRRPHSSQWTRELRRRTEPNAMQTFPDQCCCSLEGSV